MSLRVSGRLRRGRRKDGRGQERDEPERRGREAAGNDGGTAARQVGQGGADEGVQGRREEGRGERRRRETEGKWRREAHSGAEGHAGDRAQWFRRPEECQGPEEAGAHPRRGRGPDTSQSLVSSFLFTLLLLMVEMHIHISSPLLIESLD